MKTTAKQVLVALDVLYHKCGVIHTSTCFVVCVNFLYPDAFTIPKDIKPSSILLTLENADNVIEIYINEVSKLDTSSTVCKSSPPVVLSRPLSSLTLEDVQNLNGIPSNYEIRLADFGIDERCLRTSSRREKSHLYLTLAATVEGFHAEVIQPIVLRAPEFIIGNGWGTSADIWSVACLVSKSMSPWVLFST